MMENFGPDIGEPQVACRTFEQANAELVFQISDAAANGRDRQLEAARCLREAFGLDDLGEDDQGVEVRHGPPEYEKLLSGFAG